MVPQDDDEETTLDKTSILRLVASLQEDLNSMANIKEDGDAVFDREDAEDDEATKTVCLLWDLAGNTSLAVLMQTVGLGEVLASIIAQHETRPYRLVEVSLGALANMALSSHVRREMALNASVVKAPFLTVLSNPDAACLREACRLLHATTADVDLNPNPWREDLCDEPVLNQLLCFLMNALDEVLLQSPFLS